MGSLQYDDSTMSQNKTRVPGMDSEDSNFYGGQQQQPTGSFYSRRNSAAAHGTVVPGMEAAHQSEGGDSHVQQQQQTAKGRPLQVGKPIVGFLYSISRTPAGEFWPLQIGPNKIGTNPSSDIILSEGTVSQDHAVLVVRKLKSSGNVIASITDAQSTNGTMLNGESLGFTPVECHNGDKIVIGENYELVLILIDTAKMELSAAEGFIPLETPTDDVPTGPEFPGGFTNPGMQGGFDGPVPPPFGGYQGGGGTVGLDGGTSMGNKGGTKSI